jgi:DNA-binding transcriptional ArsR family regulator
VSTLDQIKTDITQRLGELQEAVAEHAQLLAVKKQWDEVLGTNASAHRNSKPGNGRRRRRRTVSSGTTTAATAAAPMPAPVRRATRRTASKRAPRGQNRAKVLAMLTAAPAPLFVADLAAATGIGDAVVYQVLAKLAESGAVEKRDAGGGRVAYIAIVTAANGASSSEAPSS